jgi:hypothetical protein
MPFQKGQSGNPGGRPKDFVSLTAQIEKLLRQRAHDGRTRAEHVADVLIGLALGGDTNAIKMVLERIDGKVVQPIAQSGSVTVEHVDRPTIAEALDYAAERRAERLRALA